MKKFADKRVLLIGGVILSLVCIFIIGSLLLKEKKPVSTETEESFYATDETEDIELMQTEVYSQIVVDTEANSETQIESEISTETEIQIETETDKITEAEDEATSDVSQKKYKLPVIYITTENKQEIKEKDTKIPGSFSLDYNGTYNYQNIDSASMDIKGRGHSTWKLEKKPYKMKFDEKISLFGLTEAKEWVLLANHADKSLIRNKLAMDVGNILDNVLFTPHAFNVDVYVNGDYKGVYTLVEQIEVKDGRIEGEKDSTEVNTDYLLELGGEEETTSFGTSIFHSLLYVYIEIKNPDSDVLTKEQYDYVRNYVVEADCAVKELDGYEEYIDVPSLIDWFLLNELSYNIDGTFRRSDYMLKKKDGKLYMATYWDYDYAFGNFWRDSNDFDEWICLGNENTVDDEYIKDNWITFLLEDPNFRAQLKQRWNEVGSKIYQTSMAAIDDAEKNVSPSAKANFERWPGILGKKIQYENKSCAKISTYEGQLKYLRDYIQKRYEWMDKTIKEM